MTRRTLHETRIAAEATPVAETPGTFRVQLITPGWGSCGYYSPELLESAARRRVFPAGTHMYLDHPTATEETDRPERSLRDLAAVLTEDAAIDDAGGLVGTATVFGPFRAALNEMKDSIGVSIRATAEVEQGEAEGHRGTIVSTLVEGLSADFVTKAGRGGKVLEVVESARFDARLEEAGEMDSERQRRMRDAVRDLYSTENAGAWVQDFDDDYVYFERYGGDDAGCYRQSYTDDGGTVTLTGSTTEVRPVTTYVPVDPAGQLTTEENAMPQIEERELTRLREADGRVPVLETERDTAVQERDEARTQRDAAGRELATHRAASAGRTRATAAFAESTLPPAAQARVIGQVVAAPPLTEAGQLDEAAFDVALETARKAEETYLASLAEAAGAVHGFGATTTTTGGTVTKEAADAAVASAFDRQPANSGKG